jgi:hypothetical protein
VKHQFRISDAHLVAILNLQTGAKRIAVQSHRDCGVEIADSIGAV